MLSEFFSLDTNAPQPDDTADVSLRVQGATRRSSSHCGSRYATVTLGREPTRGANRANRTSGPTRRAPRKWRLGLVTDRTGHVHLGAVVAANDTEPLVYIDLLAAVGAASASELDLDRLVVLVRGEAVADLRRLIENCIDDVRLRNRLVELTELSTSVVSSKKWTG